MTNTNARINAGSRMTRRRMLKGAGATGALAAARDPLMAVGGAALGSTLAAPAVSRAQEGITLRGIFLPATWGTITQEVFAPEYTAETGVNVVIDLIGRDAIHDRMGTLFVAQDPSYDIFNVDYNWVPEFARAGHLLPMDDVLAAPEMNGEDFLPTGRDVARWDGALYGIPQTVHPHILWYRRDLFEEAGLEPPATMQEWRQNVEFFQGQELGDQTVYGWAAQAARGFGNVHTWLTFLYSFGGDAFNYETMEPTLTTPEATEATAFWADMMQFTPPGINDYTYDEVTADAAAGRIATCLQWSWGAFAVDDPEISQTVGLWEFVKVPAGTASVPHLAEWVISVSNYSQQQEEAVKFIQWLESPENDVRQALLGGGDPVRAGSYENPELTDATVEGYPDLLRFRRYPETLEAMQTTKPRPLFPEEERWEQVVSVPLHAIQLGEMTVEERLAEAEERDDAGNRHAAFFLQLVEHAAPELDGPNQGSWLDRIAAEHDNLNVALDWANERPGGATALRLAAAIWPFWDARGHYTEGRAWLERALAHDAAAPKPVLAAALSGAGSIARMHGDSGRATELLQRALTV